MPREPEGSVSYDGVEYAFLVHDRIPFLAQAMNERTGSLLDSLAKKAKI
jgi:hypothetical protein